MATYSELEQAVLSRDGSFYGVEIWFRCPFPDRHKNGDANPSAKFNQVKQVWRCVACGQRGGAKQLAELLGVAWKPGDTGSGDVTYRYTDRNGQLLFEVVRRKGKKFRQRQPDGNGGWLWNVKGVQKVLYRLGEVLAAIEARQPVHVVEGEKDADNLARLGLAATTNSGGAGKWSKSYSDTLRGARVVILPDNDEAGQRHGHVVATRLAGVAAEIRIVALPDLPAGGDVSDWIATQEAAGVSRDAIREELERLTAEVPRWQPPTAPEPSTEAQSAEGEDGGNGRPSQSDILLAIAAAAKVELFHDPDRDGYARVPVDEHHEVWPVRSRDFRDWLTQGYYRQTGKAPSAQALQDAIKTLEAEARFAGEEHEVSTRVAGVGSTIYLDLCNREWEVVEVTASGWKVLPRAPVRFRRTTTMRPLPKPVADGSLSELRPLINLPDENAFALLVAFFVAALGPTGPYPVLVLHGEQGSAKSTLARLIVALVDPSSAPLRTVPRTERDLMIAASRCRLLAFDNLSGLPAWFSDALCRLSTGGGFSTRVLYTDSDEIVFSAMRPVVLNGIEEVVGRQDLVDRSLVLSLPTIPEERRRPERELWEAVERMRPRLLGALLDAVSCALQRRDQVRLDRTPRMADFAYWIVAAEPALPMPEGTFLAAYEANRGEAVETSLEADDVAVAVRDLVSEISEFEGTASELLAALEENVSESVRRTRSWPKNARALSARLRRAAPAFRRCGIEVTRGLRQERTGRRLIRLDQKRAADLRQDRQEHQERPKAEALDRDAKPEGLTQADANGSAESHRPDGRLGAGGGLDAKKQADSESTADEDEVLL